MYIQGTNINKEIVDLLYENQTTLNIYIKTSEWSIVKRKYSMNIPFQKNKNKNKTSQYHSYNINVIL